MKDFDHDTALAACAAVEDSDENGDFVINAYLIRGMYKIARDKHDSGESKSAKNIFQFLSNQYERSPHLKCAEIAMSTGALAQIAGAESKYLEAEQFYIRALSICIDYLGDCHAVTLTTFKNYGELLRQMRLPEEAVVVEMRAQESSQDFRQDFKHEINSDEHQLPLAS
jgi:hypothetical protein